MSPSINQIIKSLQEERGLKNQSIIRFKGSGKESTVLGEPYKVLGLRRDGLFVLRGNNGQEMTIDPNADAFLGAEVLRRQASMLKERR